MPVDIHPAALEEYKSALAWYLDRSEVAAGKFVEAIEHAVMLVIQSPHVGRSASALRGDSFFNAFPSRSFIGKEKRQYKSWPSHADTGVPVIGKIVCDARPYR
jgi:plasmid stabilization system protein ParE